MTPRGGVCQNCGLSKRKWGQTWWTCLEPPDPHRSVRTLVGAFPVSDDPLVYEARGVHPAVWLSDDDRDCFARLAACIPMENPFCDQLVTEGLSEKEQ